LIHPGRLDWHIRKADSLLLDAPRHVSARTEYTGLAMLLVLGAFLRLATLSHDSLWADEAYTLSVAQLPFAHLWGVPFDVHPPLFYSLVKVFFAFGLSEATVRIASALASTFTLLVVYFLTKWLIGNVGALVTLALSATSYTSLVYADDGRNYALLSAFLLLSYSALFQVVQALRSDDPVPNRTTLLGWLATYNIAAVAALYTHNSAVFYIASANMAWALVVLFTSPRELVRFCLRLVVLNGLVVLAWLPWLMTLFSTSADFTWLEQARPIEAIRTLLVTILPNNISVPGALAYLAIIGTGTIIALRRGGTLLTVVCFHLIAFPFFIWMFGFVYKPIFMERTVLPAIFGGALSVGVVLAFLRSRFVAILIACIAISLSLVSSASYLGRGKDKDHYGAHIVQDWRSAVAESPGGDRSAIVLCEPFSHPAVSFYAPDTSILFLRSNNNLLPVTNAQWRKLYGMPATARLPHLEESLARIVAEDDVSELSIDQLAERFDHVTTVRANIFCDDSFLSSSIERFRQAGFEADPLRSYPGVTARTFNGTFPQD